jgi:Flp pilus assembly protein TadD
VLRLAEHNRVWELELPESAGGYEMRIPLDGPLDSPTAADAELLASGAEAPAAAKPAPEAKPDAAAKLETAAKATPAAAKAAPAKVPGKSYLGTLAKVREMYASRRYELALVELVDLEPSHPKDARLQAMKGSVYLKLGKAQLARESWQKALALDPEDPAVAEALRTLKEE